jgi:putative transposase
MILTYKQYHNLNITKELQIAKKVAKFSIHNKNKLSSKHVKHFKLKSVISNQILRKYGKNKKCKKASNVNLIIPNQGIKFNKEEKTIEIPCLKVKFKYEFEREFIKINQIEIDKNYYYISVTVKDGELINSNNYIGIDLNVNKHCLVAGNPLTGKVLKLGKSAKHIHQKYKSIRTTLQRQGRNKRLKEVKHKERNKIKDLNHKISKKVVQWAKENNSNIKMEKLTGIRNTKKNKQNFRYYLNSWSYYQLQEMIKYKAILEGIKVLYVNPAYTSQRDSLTGNISKRRGNRFYREDGKIEDSGVNASFNIALSNDIIVDKSAKNTHFSKKKKKEAISVFSSLDEKNNNYQLVQDRDCIKRNTDILQISSSE